MVYSCVIVARVDCEDLGWGHKDGANRAANRSNWPVWTLAGVGVGVGVLSEIALSNFPVPLLLESRAECLFTFCSAVRMHWGEGDWEPGKCSGAPPLGGPELALSLPLLACTVQPLCVAVRVHSALLASVCRCAYFSLCAFDGLAGVLVIWMKDERCLETWTYLQYEVA